MSTELTGILFDLDGTLIDSAHEICNSANYVLQKNSKKLFDVEEIRNLIGYPAVEIFKAREINQNLDLLVSEFREHLGNTGGNPEHIYPGVIDALEKFKKKNISLAVATNKPTNLAIKVLASSGLLDFFDLVQGIEAGEPKPAPDILKVASQKLHSPLKSTWMIGDSPVDIQASRAAGCYSVGIVYHEEYAEKMLFESPNRVIRSLTELIEDVDAIQ